MRCDPDHDLVFLQAFIAGQHYLAYYPLYLAAALLRVSTRQ
jgi:hypothetical protein